VRKLLLFATVLVFWGPPRLRWADRPLEASIEDPFYWDWAVWLQVLCVGFVSATVVLAWLGRGLERPPVPRLLREGPLAFYGIFGVLACASVLYSVQPWYTLFFAVRFLAGLLVIAILRDKPWVFSAEELLRIFYTVHVAQWGTIVALYSCDPYLVGSELPGIGYRLHAKMFNDYGVSAAVTMFYFLMRISGHSTVTRKWLAFVVIGAAAYCVYLSRTRSTVFLAWMFLTLAAFSLRRVGRWSAVLAGGAALWMVFGTPIKGAATDYLLRGQRLADFQGLTGRASAFKYLTEHWRERTWLGYGFGAGTRVLLAAFVRRTGLGIGAAHDALSKVLVDLGVCGLVALALCLCSAVHWLVTAYRQGSGHPLGGRLRLHAVALFAAAMVRSVVSEGIADFSAMLTLAIVVSDAVRRLTNPRAARMPFSSVVV